VLIFDEAGAMLGSRLSQVTPGGARLVSVRQVPAAELVADEFALSGNP
jgi:hypothetical protein